MKPTFFASPDALFRRWLERNHGASSELWIGFYKVHSAGRMAAPGLAMLAPAPGKPAKG